MVDPPSPGGEPHERFGVDSSVSVVTMHVFDGRRRLQ